MAGLRAAQRLPMAMMVMMMMNIHHICAGAMQLLRGAAHLRGARTTSRRPHHGGGARAGNRIVNYIVPPCNSCAWGRPQLILQVSVDLLFYKCP